MLGKSEMVPRSSVRKTLLLNGKLINKEEIFEIIRYFKTLSGDRETIKIK